MEVCLEIKFRNCSWCCRNYTSRRKGLLQHRVFLSCPTHHGFFIFLYVASCPSIHSERLQWGKDMNVIPATCLSVLVCQNHLFLPGKDVGKGGCFRWLSLRAVVASHASHYYWLCEVFELVKYPPDFSHGLAGIIRESIKASLFLWHLLLHWIRITRNQWRIIVVMRIIHKEALCCWEFLVLEVQWGCPQMGGTHTHELLSLCVWGLSTQKFLIALVTQKHHFKPASRFCCCKWACSLFIGFQIKHSFILCLE